MNIDDYRRIKKEQEAQKQKSNDEGATEKTPSTEDKVTDPTPEAKETVETSVEEPKTKEADDKGDGKSEETKLPETIHIEGVGEVKLDELKNGYLRQSDYTKKTQEISNQRKEAEEALNLYRQLKSDPQMADVIKEKGTVDLPANADPTTAKINELEGKLYDMMVEKDVQILSAKYDDFDVRNVLQLAYDKNLELEDAYHVWKGSTQSERKAVEKETPTTSQLDLEAEKKRIRNEILAELEAEKKSTRTTITSQSSQQPAKADEPKLTPAEDKVRRGMDMSVEDYVTWRDAK